MSLSSPSGTSSRHHHRHTFRGASPVSNYDMMEKLGEGTFGCDLFAHFLHDKMLIANSEVWKARAVNSKELFALKKILMHNEKEGVSSSHPRGHANDSSR